MRISIVTIALALAGCAQLGAKPDAGPASEQAAAHAAQQAPQKPAPPLPDQELTNPLLFQFLVSEIASQRGDQALASRSYLDLAKRTRDPRVAQRATEMAVAARQGGDALQAAQLWLELDPNAVRARQTIAAILINQGRLQEAKPHLEKLIAEEDVNVGHGFLQLNGLLARHPQRAEVLALVQELVQPYPNLPEAHYALAQAAALAGENQLALEEVRKARKLKRGWEQAVLLEVQVQRRTTTRNDESLKMLRDFLDDYPDAREVRLAYARLLVTDRQYEPARTQFRRLLKENPGNPEVTLAVGLLSMQLKDYDSAEQQLRDVIELGYRDGDGVRVYLGQLEEERKRYPEALAWYRAVGGGEHRFQAEMRVGAVLAKQGNLAEARAHLQAAAQRDPEHKVQFMLAEAQVLREAGAYREAYELLGQGLKETPENPDLLYDHAMAAEKVDRVDVLEDNLRRLIALKPDHAHAYNALGYSLADRGVRLDEARQLIEKALALAPDDAFILDSMGWIKYRQGETRESIDYLRRAYSLRPDAEIAAHLGEVLWMSGQKDEARKVWEGARSDHPENQVLLDTMRRFVP